ncbi:MAG: lysophospholipid acyltransferase family protein [Sphingobacteriaceae bacterium]|nr:lysophospholipid acyltransferase family protein [Sphingobacteriaceae bacterium]
MFRRSIVEFFTWYIKTIIRKDFTSFNFNDIEIDNSRSVLLLANHFSWWDGFLMFQLNRLLIKKKFHVMVTEENYRNVSFLKYLGAFPVRKNTKDVIKSLEHAGELLNEPGNLVLIFPQGQLYSVHVTEIVFEKGLMRLINFSNKNFQYLFAASFVDYFEKRKPTITCYLKSWEGAEFTSLQLIKSAYNKHYETSRQQQGRIIK